jgi:hypothetical protein
MDTLALKETACFVGDFLICLSLLYGIDLAAAKLVLENINSCERVVRCSLTRQAFRRIGDPYPYQHNPPARHQLWCCPVVAGSCCPCLQIIVLMN